MKKRLARAGVVRLGVALFTLFTLAAGPASAQGQWPAQPIRVIVPYASGSNGEAGLRVVVPELEARLGQRVIVEARPGGGGNLGAQAVARSTADGYTLLFGANNNFTVNQHLYKEIGFDPVAAFDPVTIVFNVPFIIYSSTALPVRTLQELVAYAKANPEKVNFASSGAGTPPHLGAELFSQLAGIRMTHVPYRSAAQSQQALLAGDVHVYLGLISGAQQHVDAGRLRILSTAVPQRAARHPDVPSAAESGYPTLDVNTWWALAAPRGTPRAVVERVYDAVRGAVADGAVKERYAQLGMVPIADRPEDLAKRITAESAVWGDVIRARNIRVE